MLKIALVALVVAGVCGALSTCAAFLLMPTEVVTVVEVTATPTETSVPVPTKVIPTLTPEPTEVPLTPTPYPAPTPTLLPTATFLTVGAIKDQREELTDLQRELYDQNIIGEVVRFAGRVSEVYEDGSISIDDGSDRSIVVTLHGVPYDTALGIQKNQLVRGTGTVTELYWGLFGIFFHVDLQVTSLE